MNAKKDIVIANARIVLAERVIEQGWLALADGRIAEIGEGRAPAGSEDAGGDLIMPGLIAEKKQQSVALLGIFHDADVRNAVADRVIDVTEFAAGRIAA